MRMFTGDLKPDLIVTLSGDTPVDATDAESVRIIGKRNGEVVIDEAVDPGNIEVVGDTSTVLYQWQAGETDTPGYIEIEVELSWPGARKQTFRADSKVAVVTDFDATT